MGTVSVSLPSDGSTIDAADYNTPITTIVNEFNGNIDNANIKSAAAIAGSKLADASIDLGLKGSVFDGWIAVSDSWAYASATTITIPSDGTTKYSAGDRIKLVQSATTKYFTIDSVTATLLTVTGGTGFTVANSAISGIYYSKANTPLGMDKGTPKSEYVATSETTTSTSYTDLATTGPDVSVTIGASGMALVMFGCVAYNSSANFRNNMAIAMSGANTETAGTTGGRDLTLRDPLTSGNQGCTTYTTYLATGLTSGSTTFTAKYRVQGGTGTFATRQITVIPL